MLLWLQSAPLLSCCRVVRSHGRWPASCQGVRSVFIPFLECRTWNRGSDRGHGGALEGIQGSDDPAEPVDGAAARPGAARCYRRHAVRARTPSRGADLLCCRFHTDRRSAAWMADLGGSGSGRACYRLVGRPCRRAELTRADFRSRKRSGAEIFRELHACRRAAAHPEAHAMCLGYLLRRGARSVAYDHCRFDRIHVEYRARHRLHGASSPLRSAPANTCQGEYRTFDVPVDRGKRRLHRDRAARHAAAESTEQLDLAASVCAVDKRTVHRSRRDAICRDAAARCTALDLARYGRLTEVAAEFARGRCNQNPSRKRSPATQPRRSMQ